MTIEQFDEVKNAANEMYTLDEIYFFLASGRWSNQMFKKFMEIYTSKARRTYYNHF